MANPYDSHPIYWLRRCLLILASFSFILGLLACANAGRNRAVWAFHMFWTFCSALWCIHDLVRYALAKARDPAGEPTWPSKKIMIGDAILVVLFGWWYSLEVLDTQGYYSSNIFTAYATITALFYVFLHAVCFWKELIALKKAAWLKELHNNGSSHQCRSCQQRHVQTCCPQEQGASDIEHTQEPAAREQAALRTLTPKSTSWFPAMLRRQKRDTDDVEASAESANESTCLITPLTDDDIILPGGSAEDDGANEQSIEHREDSEAVVKKKAKKGSKTTSGDGKRKEDVVKDILEQVEAYEAALP